METEGSHLAHVRNRTQRGSICSHRGPTGAPPGARGRALTARSTVSNSRHSPRELTRGGRVATDRCSLPAFSTKHRPWDGQGTCRHPGGRIPGRKLPRSPWTSQLCAPASRPVARMAQGSLTSPAPGSSLKEMLGIMQPHRHQSVTGLLGGRSLSPSLSLVREHGVYCLDGEGTKLSASNVGTSHGGLTSHRPCWLRANSSFSQSVTYSVSPSSN